MSETSGGCSMVDAEALYRVVRAKMLRRLYNIVQRCYNRNHPEYCNYGAVGARVCDKWLDDKDAFVEHALRLPGALQADYVLSRLDATKDYAPGNVHFKLRRDATCAVSSEHILRVWEGE